MSTFKDVLPRGTTHIHIEKGYYTPYKRDMIKGSPLWYEYRDECWCLAGYTLAIKLEKAFYESWRY